jgi:predicted ATPase/DNA-binding SARP family transcriptional activator
VGKVLSPMCSPDPPLKVQLFGEFDVEVHDQPLPRLHSCKGKWLLALLILRHGTEVSREKLAETLWPDSDKRHALHSLGQSLSDLCRALGREAGRISRKERTLRLALTGAQVDVVAFDEAIRRGDPASLGQAVSLYRGRFLAGCDEDWVSREQKSREQDYLTALTTLAGEALDSGDPAAAVRWLRKAVSVDPACEETCRALMEALAANRDFGGVIAVYDDLRRYLRKKWNEEPSPETTTLRDKICKARQESERTGRLPCPLTRLVGRENELHQIQKKLASHRLVTLTGEGGVGKSRLAIRVAEKMLDSYPDGVWFVDLAPLAYPNRVLDTVASTFGLEAANVQVLSGGLEAANLQTLSKFLHEKKLLLILDNCEHLCAACAQLAGKLLPACPGLRILATSQHRLKVMGEEVWRVPNLQSPNLHSLDGADTNRTSFLMKFHAVQLFVERAEAANGLFEVTDANAPAIAEICHRLGGNPLAIELVAPWVDTLSVERIASEVDELLELPTGDSQMARPHHRTVRATMDWSYHLLEERERKFLTRLAIFAGGCTVEAANAVCAGNGIEEWEVLDLLRALVTKSLIIKEERHHLQETVRVCLQVNEERYRLQETVRVYLQKKLAEAHDTEALLRRRHAEYFLGLAEQAEAQRHGPEQGAWLKRLDVEHHNLRAVLDWSRKDVGSWAVGLRLAGALALWYYRIHTSEGRERLRQLLESPRGSAPPAILAKAHVAAGILAFRQGLHQEATKHLEKAEGIYGELKDLLGLATALTHLGRVARHQGDYDGARDYLKRSLHLFKLLKGDRDTTYGTAYALINRARVEEHDGQHTKARQFAKESLRLFRRIGDSEGISGCLHTLADIALHLGQPGEAHEYLVEALPGFEELGDLGGQAYCLHAEGIAAYQEGNLTKAVSHYSEALKLWWPLGVRWGIAHSLERIAGLGAVQGQTERPVLLFAAANRLRESIDAVVPRPDLIERDRHLDALRTKLGAEAFDATWEEGWELTLDEAVKWALESATPALRQAA